ncbi:hypothetical protein [Microbacterium allomyrinae]|uniref:Uncharacterized protein n=1 Tax=Microbacterium allomyrinae TaxID=2830666 RepID=A0A9X1S317_9MICO|nr:hypothetical protein [Microbacterium allomyrinae]MCC2032684.1 hypothetical protein [Microbacterium allomyrinae]
MSTSLQARRRVGIRLSPILVIGIATVLDLAIVWLVAVPIGPEACALSLPGPRNCVMADRVQAAGLPTLAIIIAAAISIALVLVSPKRARPIAICAVILLLLLTAASYVVAGWIPALAWSWRSGIEL